MTIVLNGKDTVVNNSSTLLSIIEEKGINPAENHLSIAEYKEIQYNKLADLIRNSLDMDAIYKVLFGEKKEMVRCA